MIKTQALSKHYRDLIAVDRVSFTVEPGQVLGFLGPNGAGKTTTMRMIAGFLTPSGGSASVCGHDVESDPIAAKSCIGYLPEGAPAYGDMTPLQYLDFVADLRRLRGERKHARLDAVTALLHLEPVLHQPIETLSKGFKRRVGLAQAILHDPPVLILDEPTDGLDPNQKHEVRTLIRSMAAAKTIVISTHILEEVDAVCDRVAIIANGRLVTDETPQALAARSRYHNAVSLRVDQQDRARAALAELADVEQVELDAESGCLTVFPRNGQPLLAAVTDLIRRQGWQVQDLRVEAGRLDEVFRRITLETPA